MVAVAYAVILHIRCSSVWAKLFRIWNKRIGIEFCFGKYKKNTGSIWLCVLFHCIQNSLSGIYIINDNIWGNITATIIMILCSYIWVKINDKTGVFNR